MRVAGKVALISGAAGGIGAASARLLAKEGAAVMIADILEEQGQATAIRIGEAGGRAQFIRLDVTDAEEWRWALKHTVDNFGRLDILVNNAGVSHRTGVEDTTTEAWDRVMDVNVKGVFLGTQVAIPEMRKAGGGQSSTSPPFTASSAVLFPPATMLEGGGPHLYQVGCRPVRQ